MIKMATVGPLDFDWSDLEINDRYIAALIYSSEGKIFTIWDWKSGECVLYFIYYTAYIPRSHTISPLA
jgi:hypothetical protein